MTKLQSHLKKLTLKDYIVLFFTTIITLYLLYLLIANPIIGKADNGDFARMYKFISLSDFGNNYNEIYDGFLHTSYSIDGLRFFSLWSSNWVFGGWILKISLILNLIFNPSNYTPIYLCTLVFFIGFILIGIKLIMNSKSLLQKKLFAVIFTFISSNIAVYSLLKIDGTKVFNIRFVGIIYAFFFILGVYWILNCKRLNNFTRIAIGAFIMIFFTDICYLGYFNSFFGEAATISFLFMTIGTFLRLIEKKSPSKFDFILFFFSSFAFLTSKTQQLPLIIFMILIYIALYIYYKNYKPLIVILSVLVICIGIMQFLSICEYTNKNNIYQAVFTGILKDSPTPEDDLIELGLDPKFASNAGPSFYGKDLKFDPLGDEMLTEFYPNISLSKILKFYATHPERALSKFIKSAENAYTFYKLGPSSFEKGANFDNKLINTFRTNLTYKYPQLHKSFLLFFSFSLIYLLTLIYYFIKSKSKETKLLTLLLLFLLACGASQIVLPVIGSGEADFGKHLFLMNLSYDILLGTVIVFLCNKISKLKISK